MLSSLTTRTGAGSSWARPVSGDSTAGMISNSVGEGFWVGVEVGADWGSVPSGDASGETEIAGLTVAPDPVDWLQLLTATAVPKMMARAKGIFPISGARFMRTGPL